MKIALLVIAIGVGAWHVGIGVATLLGRIWP
jgi:hypothetical protein